MPSKTDVKVQARRNLEFAAADKPANHVAFRAARSGFQRRQAITAPGWAELSSGAAPPVVTSRGLPEFPSPLDEFPSVY